ncbi:hypothetical protein GCM10011325_44380 [Dyadobacter sediminis]|nr:hypothetical protein GCM10011325_44380 [Dyadobacter sediminis]
MIKGLVSNHSYKIEYYISAAKVQYNFQYYGIGNYKMDLSWYVQSAKVEARPSDQPLAQTGSVFKNYYFGGGTNADEWIPDSLTFTANSDSASFTISGVGVTDSPGVVNLDVVGIEPVCSATKKQISLSTLAVEPCFGSTLDLTDIKYLNAIPQGTPKNPLPGFEVRIFDNPNHTGNQVKTVSKSGKYYYFFYDSVAGCYNTDNSTAGITVTFKPEQQVDITLSSIVNKCAGTTADLNTTHTSTYPVVWYKTPGHVGTQISNPESVGAGTYYAFFKDPDNGCFFTNNSTSKVVVNIPIQEQVALKGSTITKLCPTEKANLTGMIDGTIPAGTEVRWFTNKDHQGTSVTDPTAVGAGNYYPFLYDVVNQCYKTVQSGFTVSVGIVPEAQVQLNSVTINNECPSTAVDLTKSIASTVPADWKVVWYQNNAHSGAQVKNPAAVSTNGSYYPFFFNTNTSCFQTVTSTSKLDVQLSRCDIAPTQITLNAKVFLQGAMQADTMHNQLQTYFPDGTGLLPVSDPYDGSSTYDDIYNVQGVAGTVVDWVRVEIRNGLDPHFLLEAKNLLLKTNGKIVDMEGREPIFSFQSIPVRVVVKHRNHVPVMSNALNFTNKSVAYDFTTSLLQASNTGNDPAQMIQVNGVWCMWAGDVNDVLDMGIDATDYNTLFFSNTSAPFDVYIREDLNMDGGIDVTDLNILFFNNGISPYSTILNY